MYLNDCLVLGICKSTHLIIGQLIDSGSTIIEEECVQPPLHNLVQGAQSGVPSFC